MSCGCQHSGNSTNDANAFLSCARFPAQQLVEDSTLVQFAASAGARSSDFTMCYVLAVLRARRLIYWKASPPGVSPDGSSTGDCGSAGVNLTGSASTSLAIGHGIGSTAALDPEPISKSILSGVAAIFSVFGAAHAQAVADEQKGLCAVTVSYNRSATQIEQAVKQGLLTSDQAFSLLTNICDQLDQYLAPLAKTSGDFAAGFRIALKALLSYNQEIVFPDLAPSINVPILTPVISAITSPPVSGSTYSAPGQYTTPLFGNILPSGGSSSWIIILLVAIAAIFGLRRKEA